MNEHQASLIIFLGVIAIIAAINALTLRRLGAQVLPDDCPAVSVLVPARNEAHTIEVCVHSLLAQDYPNYELLVLDDESEDGTRAILERLALQAPALRVIAGKPLPEGWLGKHWACHQLAQAAKGQLLLFTDADTRHEPTTLSCAVVALRAGRLDLLSAIPRQETGTLGERLLVLPLLWCILSFFPLPLAYLLHIPWLGIACGQLMLFERRAYEAIGGHAAVRDNVLDDVALAKRVLRRRMRYRLVNGSRHVHCRMYRSFREAWSGFSKNLYAVFGHNPLVTVSVWVWLTLVHLEPTVVLAARAAGVRLGMLNADAALLAAALALGTWAGVYALLGVRVWSAVLYPASVVLYAGLALSSMWSHLRGEARWKGRTTRMRTGTGA